MCSKCASIAIEAIFGHARKARVLKHDLNGRGMVYRACMISNGLSRPRAFPSLPRLARPAPSFRGYSVCFNFMSFDPFSETGSKVQRP